MSYKEVKLKYIATLNPSKSELNLAAFQDKTVSFLPMDKIISPNNLDLSLEKTIEEVYSGYTYFRENDIVLAKVTPCFENGNIAIAKELKNGIGFGTTELHVLRVNEQLYDKEYIYYCLQIEDFKSEAVANMYGVGGLKRIPTEFLSEYKFLVPDLKTQVAIRKYLNLKLIEISSLIENKNKLIKLLEQQRQSIITEAVTKGLNPNVKMKHSGVEWIGEIPEHWEVNKIKFKFDIRKVIQPTENPTVLSLTQRGLKIKDLKDFSGQHAESYDKYQKVELKDYVMNGMDLLTGYVDCSPFEGVTSPDYRVFRIKDNTECHDYYLRYFQICYFAKIFYGHGQGVSNFGRWRLQTDVFKDFPIPVPPKVEQFEISEYLKAKENEIDKALELIKLDIEKLKEYRQALIYEAVTGKIDVRELELD